MFVLYYVVMFIPVVLLFSSLAFLDVLVREGLALNELEEETKWNF